MEWYQYILIIGAGIIAGFINTLAGSGSLLTLPLLIFIGLPPNVANGTNRIAIMLQSLVGSMGFKQQGLMDMKSGVRLGIPSVLGSIAGALIALTFSSKMMGKTIGILLIIMFFIILFKPDKWLKGKSGRPLSEFSLINFIIFFLIGVYGGFVQAGVGFFLLGGLVMGVGLDLVKANAIKNFLVFLYTPFALIVYMAGNLVDYKAGLILSIGSVTGAWLGTKTAVAWGPVFIRYVLLIAILVSAVQLIFF
jgi:uncharacterized membrane protein YfcA